MLKIKRSHSLFFCFSLFEWRELINQVGSSPPASHRGLIANPNQSTWQLLPTASFSLSSPGSSGPLRLTVAYAKWIGKPRDRMAHLQPNAQTGSNVHCQKTNSCCLASLGMIYRFKPIVLALIWTDYCKLNLLAHTCTGHVRAALSLIYINVAFL